MNYQKNYELLIDEIEALLSFVGPANDSRIDIIPPLYDEIQEVMPNELFVETAPLVRKCRRLVSKYKMAGDEEAKVALDSLSVSVSEIKQIVRDYVVAIEYESSLDRTYNERP